MKTKTIVKVILGVLITSFIFVLSFMITGVCHAEEVEAVEEAVENVEATQTTIQTAIEWLKSFSADDIKGWFIAFCVKFGIDTTILLTLAIALIRVKLGHISQEKLYQDLIAKLDAQHQEKVEQLIKEFDTKLEEVNKNVVDSINQLDDEKRKEAESDIAVVKDKLTQLKAEIEK